MTTLFSISFCDTWWVAWLLLPLLGLALGWLLWGKYKDMVESLVTENKNLSIRLQGLLADLADCKTARAEADGNVSMLRGRMRELEASGTTKSGAVKLDTTTAATFPASIAATTVSESSNVADDSVEGGDAWFTAIGRDKLQVIEGIGPKMEEVLKENGINDFNKLSLATPHSLRAILDKYGDKYRIIDPNTWPQQAALADIRQWDDLINLQKTLDTGRSDTVTDGQTDSKLEKWLIKAGIIRRWTQDDLKAVEGIGPKIEALLYNAGIRTWKALSETPVSSIQEILTAAGPRFALADPGTWPKQSGLAAVGKWDELQVLQDALNSGKSKK
jgi:predicted flap endonuclease-1-like 5' DNA nuclease